MRLGELGVLGRFVLDELLEAGDQRPALVRLAHRRAGDGDHLPPRGGPRRRRIGDDRRDLAQQPILVRGDAGIDGEDQVRLQRRDLFDGRAAGIVEGLGSGAPMAVTASSIHGV